MSLAALRRSDDPDQTVEVDTLTEGAEVVRPVDVTELERLRAQVAAMRAALEAEEEAYQLYRAAALLAPGAELRAMRERWRQATHRAAGLHRRGLEVTGGH